MQIEYNKATVRTKFTMQCVYCKKIMHVRKRELLRDGGKYCSNACYGMHNRALNSITLKCSNCNKMITRTKSQLKKSKSGRVFCSLSCSTSYSNKNSPKKAINRSKLEKYLATTLKKLCNIEFSYNDKETIGLELDIFIPELKLAFEIDGPWHIKPIHGKKKFKQIQANDRIKENQCYAQGIALVRINITQYDFRYPKDRLILLQYMHQVISHHRVSKKRRVEAT